MNKMEILWIRACKSKNPRVRIQSIYRRFYYHIHDSATVSAFLSQIIQDYLKPSLMEIFNELKPSNYIADDEYVPYWYKVETTLINIIRLAEIEKFKGYIPPRRFRVD